MALRIGGVGATRLLRRSGRGNRIRIPANGLPVHPAQRQALMPPGAFGILIAPPLRGRSELQLRQIIGPYAHAAGHERIHYLRYLQIARQAHEHYQLIAVQRAYAPP